MSPWAKRTTKPIPKVSSPAREFEFNDYSKGMNSHLSNDAMKEDGQVWRVAQDARIPTIGEYETRKGFDFHSDAAGETQDQAITSTTGAADQSFSTTTYLAQKFVAAQTGRLTKFEPRLKNDASAQGTILLEYYTDDSGEPGTLIGRTSIAGSAPTGSYAYLAARYADAPTVTSGTTYWVIGRIQDVGSGSYKWASTTSATTALVSTDSGSTWSSTSFALNFKQYYATSGTPKGMYRAYKSDGTAVTLFVHDTTLYRVDNSTGALTSVKTGLNASATDYRFVVVNDIVYYVNGYDGLRKWDFTTESQVNTTNYSHIAVHKGLLFLVSKDDPNKVVFSNFGEYEVFTSTDFIYAPAPKTGDPVTAILSLNDYLFIWTRRTNYILFGSDNTTFQLGEASVKKGTYRQETVTHDRNFAYFLTDDGVRYTNGTETDLLSRNIYEDIRSLPNKDEAVLNANKGRLYLWYTPDGEAGQSRCWVFNLNYNCVESFDTDAFVSHAMSAFNDDDRLLVASSRIGQVYWQELNSNDHTNLGGDINFLLGSHFMHFGTAAHKKEIRYWKPRFEAQSGNWYVECLYGYDLRDSLETRVLQDVQGLGNVWGDSGTVWGSFTWGTTAEVQSDLYIPGEYRRVKVAYRHYATRQPVRFLGHTFVVQTRRLK